MKKNDWLLDHSKNIHSQRGEDGILEKIFEIIPVKNPWCVEFGAWDGKHLSNTHALMEKTAWSGVFIEADPKRVLDLKATYKDNPRAVCLTKFVAFEGTHTLDAILGETAIPKDFALLSIDIDGNDYHIWDSLTVYRPQVVIIEYNPTIPNHVDFVQPRNMHVNQGSSLAAVTRLAKTKGYELVSVTSLNAIFVLREHFAKFEIQDNSLTELNKNSNLHTTLFHLYDGTVVLHGCDTIMWHGVKINPKKLQQIPRFFRVFPSNMSKSKLLLLKVWRKYIY